MQFTAIDFETANPDQTSACAIGMVVVEDGTITKRVYRLIKPEPLVFSHFNVAVHGITADQVLEARYFPDVWDELAPMISGPLLAHNQSTDINVLRKCLAKYQCKFSPFGYCCSLKVARRVWPDLGSHRLNHLARHLGISINHHHALSDAEACALVTLAACRLTNTESIEDLAAACQVGVGILSEGNEPLVGNNVGPSGVRRRPPSQILKPQPADPDRHSAITGKNIAATGRLEYFTKADLRQAVESRHGIFDGNVKMTTHFLVVNKGEKEQAGSRPKSGNFRKAEQLIARGQPLEIITETEFLALLDKEPNP